MEPVNDLEKMVGNLEKMLISHQQERKKIKTEKAMEKDIIVEAYVERIKGLAEEVTGFKLQSWMDKETIKEIMLKNAKANQTVEELSRKISACEDAKKMSDWIQEDMKRRELENLRCVENLRQKNLEASRNVEELRSRMLAYEEEKKTASRVQEELILRELENKRCVEDLRRQNSEAEELRSRVLAFEEDKKMSNLVLDEMKIKETEYFQCLEDLRRKNSEADRKVEELRDRVSALEEENRMSVRVWEEMKIRETENLRCLEDLRRKNSEADRKVEELRDQVSSLEEENRMAVRVWKEMKVRETDSERRLERQKLEADKRMNEMKVRESDLRRQILEADDRVKEMEGRSLEACKAAEVNKERFRNMLPIDEDLWKLLKMKVDDLVSMKEKFGFGTDEEGLISSSEVSGDSRAGATTTNGVAGPHARNKAVEELTVSDTEQPTKKRCNNTDKLLNKRKLIFGADMVRAFDEDDELCLHAVCALYRQHVSTSQSTESSNKRLYHFEALRGVELAGCLIGGDLEEHSSLTRPVDEIKQRYPDIVNQCRKLAIYYSSYFTAMPRTNEPLSRSLSLVCCDRYWPSTHPYGVCGTCGQRVKS